MKVELNLSDEMKEKLKELAKREPTSPVMQLAAALIADATETQRLRDRITALELVLEPFAKVGAVVEGMGSAMKHSWQVMIRSNGQDPSQDISITASHVLAASTALKLVEDD